MNLTQAFWDVVQKFFIFRPIALGCCDCKKTYYLTKSMVIFNMEEEDGTGNPVIRCPNCGLRHVIMFFRIGEDITEIEVEAIVR